VLELLVDRNSQGLKNTRGRVNFVASLWAARRALGDRDHEIGDRPLREFGSTRDNCTGNRSARAFFPESLKQIGQLGLSERRQQIGHSRSGRGIKSHIERVATRATLSPALDPESPRRVGQLI
jgi:hypothetical protein